VRLAYARSPDASDCPTASELQAAIADRLGYDPFDVAGPSTVIAVVSRQDGELRASVDVVDERGDSRGHRDIESADTDCRALAGALALSISIAIDPEHAMASEGTATESASSEAQPSGPVSAESPPSHRAPVPASVPPEAPAPDARPSPADLPVPEPEQRARPAPTRGSTSKPPSRRRGFLSGALLFGTAGALPKPSLGGSLFGAVDVDRLAFGFELRGVNPTLSDFQEEGHFRSWMVAGGVSPCYVAGPVWLCGVALMGVLRADSFDVRRPDGASGVYLALGSRARFVQRLTGRLGLALEGEMLVTPAPVVVQLDGQPEWTAPIAGGSVGLGPVWRFR